MSRYYYSKFNRLTSELLNEKVNNFLYKNCLLTDMTVNEPIDGTVNIGEFFYSSNGIVVNNHDSTVYFDSTGAGNPCYLLAYCSSHINNAFDETGIAPDPNNKGYDDYIEYCVLDHEGPQYTTLALRFNGDWTTGVVAGLANSSLVLHNHIDNEDVGIRHFLEYLRPAYFESTATPEHPLMTVIEVLHDATTNYGPVTVNNLKSSLNNQASSFSFNVGNKDTSSLILETFRSNKIENISVGINGYVDAALSDATPGKSCWYNSINADTSVSTILLIDNARTISSIIVSATGDTSGIKCDISLNDTADPNYHAVLYGCDLDRGYVVSDDYSAAGQPTLTTTQLRLKFHLPAVSGGDFWTTKTNNPTSRKCYRLSKNNDCIYSFNTYNPLQADGLTDLNKYLYYRNSWVTLTPCVMTNMNHAHVASGLGIRKIAAQYTISYQELHAYRSGGIFHRHWHYYYDTHTYTYSPMGELYSGNADTWRAIGGTAGDQGIGHFYIEDNAHEWHYGSANVHQKSNDLAEAYVSLTPYSTPRSAGSGAFNTSNGDSTNDYFYVYGGHDSTSTVGSSVLAKYNQGKNTWSNHGNGLDGVLASGYSSTSAGQCIIVGGWTNNGVSITNKTQIYTDNLGTWAYGMAHPTNIYDCAATTTPEDTMLLTHGSTAIPTNSTFTNATREYTPPKSIKLFGFAAKIVFV